MATPTSRMEALIIYHQVGQIFESEFMCVRNMFRAILWMPFCSELCRVRSVPRARTSVTRVYSAGFSKSPVIFLRNIWLFFNKREFFFDIFSSFHVFTQHFMDFTSRGRRTSTHFYHPLYHSSNSSHRQATACVAYYITIYIDISCPSCTSNIYRTHFKGQICARIGTKNSVQKWIL